MYKLSCSILKVKWQISLLTQREMEYNISLTRRLLVTRQAHVLWLSVFVLFTIFYVGFCLRNEQLNSILHSSPTYFSLEEVQSASPQQLEFANSNLVDPFTGDLMVMANMGSQKTTLDK